MEFALEDLSNLIYLNPTQVQSPQNLRETIKFFFSSPDVSYVRSQKLMAALPYIIQKCTLPNKNKVLVELSSRLFFNIYKLGFEEMVLSSITNILSNLQFPNKFASFQSDENHFLYLSTILLWYKLYDGKGKQINLINLGNLLAKLSPYYKFKLEKLYDDFPDNFLMEQVRGISEFMLYNCQQFMRQTGFILDSQSTALQSFSSKMMGLCELLKMIYASNKRQPRIDQQQFYFPELEEHIRLRKLVNYHLSDPTEYDPLKYPFLFKLEQKQRILQIGSEFPLDNGSLDESGFQRYWRFQVNRNNILEDSMEILSQKNHFRKPLRIKFVGEQGSDEGGVKKQYFQLLMREIFNEYQDMFIPKNNNTVYWINGFSFQPPIKFQFVGTLFGLAIKNNVQLDVKLPNIFFKKLVRSGNEEAYLEENLNDLVEIDEDLANSLKYINSTEENINELELFYNIQMDNLGEKKTIELLQGGNSLRLTNDNKTQYISLFCDYVLNRHASKQFKAFEKGFHRVIGQKIYRLLKICEGEELKSIILGQENINFKELENNTKYMGYSPTSWVIKNLWQILHSFSKQKQKQFLSFCTGSDRIPINGIKGLKFTIQKHMSREYLPSAQTCFNVFLLPNYPTKQELQSKLEIILRNNRGFGLV